MRPVGGGDTPRASSLSGCVARHPQGVDEIPLTLVRDPLGGRQQQRYERLRVGRGAAGGLLRSADADVGVEQRADLALPPFAGQRHHGLPDLVRGPSHALPQDLLPVVGAPRRGQRAKPPPTAGSPSRRRARRAASPRRAAESVRRASTRSRRAARAPHRCAPRRAAAPASPRSRRPRADPPRPSARPAARQASPTSRTRLLPLPLLLPTPRRTGRPAECGGRLRAERGESGGWGGWVRRQGVRRRGPTPPRPSRRSGHCLGGVCAVRPARRAGSAPRPRCSPAPRPPRSSPRRAAARHADPAWCGFQRRRNRPHGAVHRPHPPHRPLPRPRRP